MHFFGVICPDFVHVNVVSTFWTKLVYASHGSTMSIRESGKNFIIFTYTELKENIEIIAFRLPELMVI